MRYVSTRGGGPALNFVDAMLTGLAPDGGLYVPEAVPALDPGEIAAIGRMPYEDAAARIVHRFTGDAFALDELMDLCAAAYAGFGHAARAPLAQLGPGDWLLELFHGPTLAFKDFAMQIIGQMFAHVLRRRGTSVTIVGATSGDTGSAAIEAFRGLPNVTVVILFPSGRISEVQRRQMTTPAEDNVHAVAVDGDFDDCQAALKAMFADDGFRGDVGLAAVNSINWARVAAQVPYYVTAAAALGAPGRAVDFTVPTGNFGDVYAGAMARAMGVPIGRLVVATNRNDILDRTLRTGAHVKEGVVPTISPSMDIQVSSNFERALFDATGRDAHATGAMMAELAETGGFTVPQGALQALRETYASGRADEATTRDTIRDMRTATGETLCPHSAVGVAVAGHHRGESPMVTLATAHPAKFPDAVDAATGERPGLPNRMADLYDLPERVTEAANDLSALKDLIRERSRH